MQSLELRGISFSSLQLFCKMSLIFIFEGPSPVYIMYYFINGYHYDVSRIIIILSHMLLTFIYSTVSYLFYWNYQLLINVTNDK